jgi:invasion protein IalB
MGSLAVLGVVTFVWAMGFVSASHAAKSGKQPIVVAQTKTKADKGNASAAKRITTTVSYNGWVVTCVKQEKSAPETCSAIFKVIDKKKNATIMSWLVGFNKKKVLLSEIITPTDVLIAPGVELIIDGGKPMKKLYTACGVRGCKTNFPLTKKLRSSLAKAKKVSISISTLKNRKISFNLGFQGFGKALADLLK